MASVHKVGEPVDDNERKAISYFARHLPDHYHSYHNLELPTRSGLSYEYDLIIIGDSAVHTIEVKGYRGRIRGNAREWELESGHIGPSPVPLANTKARVVASRLHLSDALKDVRVQPLIVLTDDQVKVELDDDQGRQVVLHLDEALTFILRSRRHLNEGESLPDVTSLICEKLSRQFQPLHRQDQIREYKVLETVDKNDRYTLLLAEHQLILVRFALKVYNFDIYSTSQALREMNKERVLQDAKALYRLVCHPNIVRAAPPFLWGDNQIVLPLEWFEGYSLRGLLDAKDGNTGMDFSRKIGIMCHICEALHHAHTHGVIHRDLRPNNIVVSSQGEVKLVNFDCARVEGSNMTISHRVRQYLDEHYTAPEVLMSAGAVSRASDLYAAGIILFELLTGKIPYQHIKEATAARGLPVRPTQINPHLPAKVDAVVGRMCAYRSENRYSSAEEVLKDLAQLR